jgi:hypothetical protein
MGQVAPIDQSVSFVDRANFFSKDFLKLCVYLHESEPDRETFTKRLYAQMVSSSKLLEDFLDFHGAKNSSEWYYYRELVSSVRNLSEASYSQKHIYIRLPFYNLKDTGRFEESGYATHKFLINWLRTVCFQASEEAKRLDIELPSEPFVWDDFPGIPTKTRLESDIDDENLREEQKHIVKITTEFLTVAREFEMHSFFEPHTIEEIHTIVPGRFNEAQARGFEMAVHSLQSSFDTYVNRSGLQLRKMRLKSLRGYVSIVLHLLELTRRLLHYYERHLYEVGYKSICIQVRDELAKAVPPEEILDCIVNYGLYYVCHFLVDGQSLAQELLNENVERGTIVAGVPQKMGFHSRPSLLVAKVVQHYGGQVELCVGYDRFDASSVLDLQWAGGKIHKDGIQEVVFQGDMRALKDIQILASVNYGEDSMGKGIPLPKDLSYLK